MRRLRTDTPGSEPVGGSRLLLAWGLVASLLVAFSPCRAAASSLAGTYPLANPLDMQAVSTLHWDAIPRRNTLIPTSNEKSSIDKQKITWLQCNIIRRKRKLPKQKTQSQINIGVDYINSKIINLEEKIIDNNATLGEALIIFEADMADDRVMLSIDRYDGSLTGVTSNEIWTGKCEKVENIRKKF